MEKNRDLLLVIDMQNVYLPGQEWACPSMPDVTRKVRALLDAFYSTKGVFASDMETASVSVKEVPLWSGFLRYASSGAA